MQKSTWIPITVVPIVIILAILAGRFFYYGSASAYTAPNVTLPETQFENFARSARMEAVDNPTVSRGVVVLDFAHSNALFLEELNILLSKIVARGYSYELVMNGDDETKDLANRLRYADALILPLPRDEYTAEEVDEIERFVEKGGQVLIIGDPTRTVVVEALNSIAGSFGIIYANDYLYSLENNDNNYRNVVYTNFESSPLTSGLEDGKVIFYAGGSINAPGHEIILGDDTTHSSVSEGGRTMAAAALTTDDKVLALGDLTFFGEPYSAAENNGTFINNIADFLTGATREFELKDFPYFFDSQVNIVFHNTLVFNSQFDDSVRVKDYLESTERKVSFIDKIDPTKDAIFVGRFDDAKVIQDYLDDAGISIIGPDETKVNDDQNTDGSQRFSVTNKTDQKPGTEDRFIDGRIKIAGVGDLERGGSTLFYLDQRPDQNVLIILSNNPDTNADAFDLLLKNELADCQASPVIAVCQTEKPDGKLSPSLRSSRIDKILIVSDDDGHKREDAQTSLVEYRNVLSDTYDLDVWITSNDGSPDIDQLLEYDAVIWSTGDYWDDSIAEEDSALLTKYIEVGGNLILSGASIAFDWDHTDFLAAVPHALYIDFAEQTDLELVMPDHAIADGFEEGAVIDFVDTPSGEPLMPDVVAHTSNARVIFNRGPASRQAGAASVIAYEDDRSKIAYYAFPLYMLPGETQTLLVSNTVDWFTKKPLELPAEDEYKPFESDGRASDEEPTPEATPTDEGGNTGEGGDQGDGGGNGGNDGQDNGNGDGGQSNQN